VGGEMNKSMHTILIVDDEPHILSSLKRILEGEDRKIFVAETAEKAWEILKQEGEVEVIVCDNKLPGMLGLDFLIKVKRLYPDTIRILVTGYPDLSSAMDAINKVHIWRYILKPIEVDELKILITQAFDYYRILRENRLLLRIARQQAEWLRILKEKYPQVVSQEVEKSADYALDEKRVSEIISEFMKKYYPTEKKEGK
jgi:DNA-binding NtrC family response regulator